jgi:hypothetical protein
VNKGFVKLRSALTSFYHQNPIMSFFMTLQLCNALLPILVFRTSPHDGHPPPLLVLASIS